ncbi:MAG: hypothetical protein Q9220_001181 [cf. Caloplaca sp. 1 TL-2023]
MCHAESRSVQTPHLPVVIRLDCLEIIYSLIIKPHATQPFLWDPRRMTLPVRLQKNTCVVTVFQNFYDQTDVFSEIAIARVVGLIVQRCVTVENGFGGGQMEIGAHNGFWGAGLENYETTVFIDLLRVLKLRNQRSTKGSLRTEKKRYESKDSDE